MEPSLLAAFSAPTGVASWPRRSSSCGVAAAAARLGAPRAMARTNAMDVFMSYLLVSRSERGADADGVVVAVAKRIPLRGIAIGDVAGFQRVRLLVFEAEREAENPAAFVELAIG